MLHPQNTTRAVPHHIGTSESPLLINSTHIHAPLSSSTHAYTLTLSITTTLPFLPLTLTDTVTPLCLRLSHPTSSSLVLTDTTTDSVVVSVRRPTNHTQSCNSLQVKSVNDVCERQSIRRPTDLSSTRTPYKNEIIDSMTNIKIRHDMEIETTCTTITNDIRTMNLSITDHSK